MTYEIKTDISNILKFFPNKNAKLTNISLFSTMPYNQADYITSLLTNYYDKIDDLTVTDIGACIGGNSISFSNKVKHVNAIELDKVNYSVLVHNTQIMGNNISCFNDNFNNIIYKLEQNVIYADPPWGGTDYRNNVKLEYEDNGKSQPLIDIIDKMSKLCEVMMLRLPLNQPYDYTNHGFQYIETVVIKSNDNSPMYQIIILSHIPKKNTIDDKKFPKLGYRHMKYEKRETI